MHWNVHKTHRIVHVDLHPFVGSKNISHSSLSETHCFNEEKKN